MSANKTVLDESTECFVNYSEAEYRKLKARLQELQRKKAEKQVIKLFILIFVICLVTVSVFVFEFNRNVTISNGLLISVSSSLGFVSIMVAYFSLAVEMKESALRRRILEYEAEYIKEDVEEDIFENSIKMSYKYLDQYYLQTREQAQRGFFVTICVAVFGAVLIAVGIVAMFLELAQPSVITCAAGVITEFISAIFFYLYNRTISSMSNYHNKLVLSQNISIALKIADSLPAENKVETKNLIVAELIKDINSHLIKDENDI